MLESHVAGAGLFYHHPEFDSLVRLNSHHEPIRRYAVRMHRENDVRHLTESDHDFREALRQPFTGAQIEGDASPSPIGDAELQRHKGLGLAMVLADVLDRKS